MLKRALITDLDGTIYDWVNFFAPSFRAMVHVLNRVTGLDENSIISSFQRVYILRKTLEYSFAIQELDIWQDLGWTMDEVMDKAVRPARVAFGQVRNKRLKLFPGVRETLKWLKKEKIIVAGFTLAPAYHAATRLRVLRVEQYFDILVSFYDYDIPKIVPEDVDSEPKTSKIEDVRILARSERKPNPAPLVEILNEYGIELRNAYLIGDSLAKDVYLAQQAKVNDIWAKYGTENIIPKNLETIRQISTHSNEEKRKDLDISKSVTPTYIVNNFSEVKSIIGSMQPMLPFDI